jgi:hypothetical protein
VHAFVGPDADGRSRRWPLREGTIMDPNTFRLHRPDQDEPMMFPVDEARRKALLPHERKALANSGLPTSAEDLLEALETMSRRIDDLARELNVLGHFDDGDDGPRAA